MVTAEVQKFTNILDPFFFLFLVYVSLWSVSSRSSSNSNGCHGRRPLSFERTPPSGAGRAAPREARRTSRELMTVSFYCSRCTHRELPAVDTENDVVACPAFLGGVLTAFEQ
jgi:hypothetical protein